MTTPQDAKLLPCPVCGEQPKRNGRGRSGGVLCEGPGSGVGKLHRLQTYGADQAEADAAWNTRPAADMIEALLPVDTAALANPGDAVERDYGAIVDAMYANVSGGHRFGDMLHRQQWADALRAAIAAHPASDREARIVALEAARADERERCEAAIQARQDLYRVKQEECAPLGPDAWSGRERIQHTIEALDLLLYEVRALGPAPRDDGWRGIESAPADGTDVLVCVTYNLPDGEWETIQWVDWRRDRYVWAWYSGRVDIPFLPTHWRPLPPAPAPRDDGEGG